jgi:hypothetical protein
MAGLVILAYLACVPFAAKKGGDFVHLWIGGHTVATGHVAALYEPTSHKEILTELQLPFATYWGARYELLGVFFYPPLTGILYSPLGALPLYWAQAMQAVLNIGLGLVAAWLLTKIIQHRLSFPTVIILLFTFPSFFYAYVLGQNGILTMTLVLVGWYALTREKAAWAGAWWSLLLFKPNWLIAVGWIPLVQRRWRMLVGMIIGLLTLFLLMVGTLGLAPLQAYLGVSTKLTSLHNLPQYPLSSQYSVLSLFRRYLGMVSTAELLGWSTVFGIVGMTAWVTWRQHSARPGKQPIALLTTALSLTAAVCLNPHLHHYDLMLVSIASVVALSEWSTLDQRQRIVVSGLFLFNQLAFLLAQLLDQPVPLPIFAILSIWGWLLVRVWAMNTQPNGEPIAQGTSGHIPTVILRLQ